MPTEKEALQLLKHYLSNKETIKHSLGVANVAYAIATQIQHKNPSLDIDPQKIKIAALLHDIGRSQEGVHELNTVKILEKEGLKEIAPLAMHGFVYEASLLAGQADKKLLPSSLENKIVILADMYYNQNEERVSLKTRIDDIKKRYANDKEFLKVVQLAEKRMQKVEKEIQALM